MVSMAESIFHSLSQYIVSILTYQPFKMYYSHHSHVLPLQDVITKSVSVTGIITSFLLLVSGKIFSKTRMYILYLTEHMLDAFLSTMNLVFSEKGMVHGLLYARERS